MYVGFRPVANLTNSQRWHRNTHIEPVSVKVPVVTGTSTIQINNAVYYDESHVISSLSLSSQDIQIYPKMVPSFYNSYMPMRWGSNLKAPKDLGWYMMNFNFHPGDYQPSGHLNLSMGREVYLNYTSAINPNTNVPYIDKSTPVDLIVVADCINFIFYKNSQIILKFST